MELLYITHGNILTAQALSPAFTWAILIGAGYGLFQLGRDLIRMVESLSRSPDPPQDGESREPPAPGVASVRPMRQDDRPHG